MLSFHLLRNLAGIMLIGDYTSLRALHRVLHDVNDRSPIIREIHKDGPLMALAYDIRKAYEQQREIIEAPTGYEEMGKRYGVKIIWPALLFQHRALRVSLGFLDHGPEHQAVTYALEAVLQDALREAFKGKADDIIKRWNELDPVGTGSFDKFHSRGAVFCSWSRADRQRCLGRLLQSFHPHYDEAAFQLARQADFISPAEFIRWSTLGSVEIQDSQIF